MAADEDGLPALVRDEAGDVPLLWADSPGTFIAGLVFRVGRADETLATAGITHLVEHLAMPARRLRGVDCNATVSTLFATFWAEGAPAAAVAFLEDVAAALHDLPLERLETERGIVLAEADNRSGNLAGLASALRFGAVGHGLPGFHELGLRRLEELLGLRVHGRDPAASVLGFQVQPAEQDDVRLVVHNQDPLGPRRRLGGIRMPSARSGF